MNEGTTTTTTGTGSLTLAANSDITVSHAITTQGGAVILDADTGATGGAILASANITTNGGNITLGGGATPSTTAATAGATSPGVYGVEINGVTLNADGTIVGGNITIGGAGYASGSNTASAYGVEVTGGGIVETNHAGTVSVTGTGGGTGVGTNNYGVYVTGTSSTIESTGTGTVSVTGIRGGGDTTTNYGVDIAIADGIQTAGTGNTIVTADTLNLGQASDISSGGTATLTPYSTGSSVGVNGGTGTIQYTSGLLADISQTNGYIIGSTADTNTLNAAANTWSSNVAFVTGSGAITLAGIQALGTHNLTLQSDTLPTISATPTGTGVLSVLPASVGTTMGIAGGAGSLSVSTAYLTSLGTNWTSYSFGRTDSTGLMTVNANTWGGNASFITGTGGITLAGTQTMPTNGNITLQTDGTLTFSPAGNTITTTGTGVVTIEPASASTSIGFSGAAGTLAITQAMMDKISSPTVSIGRLDGNGLLKTSAFTWESTLGTLNLESGGAAARSPSARLPNPPPEPPI